MQIYKKWWFWVIIVAVLGAVGATQAKKEDPAKETETSTVATPNNKPDATKGADAAQTAAPAKTTEAPAKAEELAYEITDTIYKVVDSSYSDEKRFRVILEISNTGNVPIYLDDCTLDFEDDEGHLLHTYNFLSKIPDIVEPGEKGYIYTNGSAAFDKDMSFEKGCNLQPKVKVKKAKGTLKRHEVTDTSLFNSDYGTVGVKGRIVNETDKEISLIYVTTVFYDKEGKVLGISGTNVTGITANDKTSFDDSGMFMEKFTVDQVDHYTVYADEMYLQF